KPQIPSSLCFVRTTHFTPSSRTRSAAVLLHLSPSGLIWRGVQSKLQNGGQIYHRSGLFSPLLSFVYLHIFPCRYLEFGDGALGEDTVWRALKEEDFFPLGASPVVVRSDGFPRIWMAEADGDWLGRVAWEALFLSLPVRVWWILLPF
ncbi:unnamed protein product, partial [Linum tenue]